MGTEEKLDKLEEEVVELRIDSTKQNELSDQIKDIKKDVATIERELDSIKMKINTVYASVAVIAGILGSLLSVVIGKIH